MDRITSTEAKKNMKIDTNLIMAVTLELGVIVTLFGVFDMAIWYYQVAPGYDGGVHIQPVLVPFKHIVIPVNDCGIRPSMML